MKKQLKKQLKKYLPIGAGLIAAIVATIFGINVIFTQTPDGGFVLQVGTTIEYASEKMPTIIETSDGVIEVTDEPATVSYVDSGKIDECPEESMECAKGANVPPMDISTPETVYNSVINQCVDFDGAYGSQCFDLMAYFHYLYTGRWLSANGTGAAYGIWDAREYNNQGNEYELIYDAGQLQAGDWVIFHNGYYGHVGMALGGYNNGYVALLGTNQGGAGCPGGGAVANVINMSLASFSGAFRPRIWIQPEPTPEPVAPTGYQEGDTFGQYLLDHGFADPETLWSEDIWFYNKQLYLQGILDYRDGQYWNNIPVGTEINLVRK